MRFPMAHTATSYFATDLEAMQATCEPFAKARPFFSVDRPRHLVNAVLSGKKFDSSYLSSGEQSKG